MLHSLHFIVQRIIFSPGLRFSCEGDVVGDGVGERFKIETLDTAATVTFMDAREVFNRLLFAAN